MNQNVKYRLSKIHAANTSHLHTREHKKCAEEKTIWCGLILYGFWCWCQIRCSELFITLCWYILEKGVYCYCFSTNIFWFGCVGKNARSVLLEPDTKQKKIELIANHISFISDHPIACFQRNCSHSFSLTWILNIRLTFHLMSPSKSICRRPSSAVHISSSSSVFFSSFFVECTNGIEFPQESIYVLRHRCECGLDNWMAYAIIYR